MFLWFTNTNISSNHTVLFSRENFTPSYIFGEYTEHQASSSLRNWGDLYMINQKYLLHFFVVTTNKNEMINFKFENVLFTKSHRNRLLIMLMLPTKLLLIKNDEKVTIYWTCFKTCSLSWTCFKIQFFSWNSLICPRSILTDIFS